MNQKNVERDLLQQEYDSNESQLAQLKHQQERLENRIAYYEKGERTPDIEFLDSLYDYFQCTVPFDFLLGNTDNIKEEHRNMYDFYVLQIRLAMNLTELVEITI